MKYWLIFIGLLALAGCSSPSEPSAKKETSPAVKVRVAQIKGAQTPKIEEFAGTFVATKSANLATRLSGWITFLGVEEGDFVRQGQVVVTLDAKDVAALADQAGAGVRQAQAQVDQARAAALAADAAISEANSALKATRAMLPEALAQQNLAKSEFKRMDLLHREGALSDQDYDRSRTQVEVAAAKVEQLKSSIGQAESAVSRIKSSANVAKSAIVSAQAGTNQAEASQAAALTPLEYAKIVSPIDGYVVKKLASVGEMASPGQVLVTIQDTRNLRLEIPVPEDRVRQFAPNLEFKVVVDAVEGDFLGKVDGIVPAGDPSSRTFVIKLRVDNPTRRILPGMYGRVLAQTDLVETLTVPSEAVVKRGELQGLFLVGPDKIAEYRLVKLGAETDGHYRVLSGLKANAQVILSPPPELHSGSPLEIAK